MPSPQSVLLTKANVVRLFFWNHPWDVWSLQGKEIGSVGRAFVFWIQKAIDVRNIYAIFLVQ